MDAMPTTVQPVKQTTAPDAERIEEKRRNMKVLVLPRRRDNDPEEQPEEINLDDQTLPQLVRRLFRLRLELADQEAYAKRVNAVLKQDKARCDSLFAAITDRLRDWAYKHFLPGKKSAIMPLTEAGLDDRKAKITCISNKSRPAIDVPDEKQLQAHFLTGIPADAEVAGPFRWNPGYWSCDKSVVNKLAMEAADQLAKDENKIAGMVEALREYADAEGGNGDLHGLASLGLDSEDIKSVLAGHKQLFSAEETGTGEDLDNAKRLAGPVLRAAATKALRYRPLPGVTLVDKLDTVSITEEA